MQATLTLERIERRLSVDMISDADWFLTRVDTSGGQLRIVESMRFTDEDVRTYGAAQIREWIAEDHRRYEAYERGDWWFLDAYATAVIGVYLGEERVGQVLYCSPVIGGIESDAPREYLDEMTQVLVTEVKEELADRGFEGLDEVEVRYVLSEAWIVDAV